jgi:hypothetical protein
MTAFLAKPDFSTLNPGTDELTNTLGNLYASAESAETVFVNMAASASPESRGTASPANIDQKVMAIQTNEINNSKSNLIRTERDNGYKGKRYTKDGSDITTKHVFDLNGNVVYFTQPVTACRGVGWTSRRETWTTNSLPIPAGSTIEMALLYVAFNWDQTPGKYPLWNVTFNGNKIAYGNASKGNGTLYTDVSSFGGHAGYEYGLVVYNVTGEYNPSGTNTLLMSGISPNKNALYPSTLVVVYRNSNETRKQIFINEECDELGVSASSYGSTPEEAIAYVPFTGMPIDISKVKKATLHSFAGSAGADEGNLLFNGYTVATNAWQGTGNTICAQAFDVKKYLNEKRNEAGIQGTLNGGMDALQQILVIEYQKGNVPLPVLSLIALPLAVILGLLFIIVRRKNFK